MADHLRLCILTPERRVVDTEVREVIAPAALGEIGVLPDHAALVTALEPGALSYRDDTRTVRFTVSGGFAEVRDNVMTILAESVEETR